METLILKYIAIKYILLELTNSKYQSIYFISIIFLNPDNNSTKLNHLLADAQVLSGKSFIRTLVSRIPKPVRLSHMQRH